MKTLMKTMKNRFWNPALALLLAATLGAAAMTAAQKSNTADVQLQAAIHKETVEGDLEQAIRMYKDIVLKYSANHAVAASALLHMGQAYEKLGSAEARKAYEQVAREYADQKEAAADAGRRLQVLGKPPVDRTATTRMLSNSNVTAFTSVSSDGGWMATIVGGAQRGGFQFKGPE
jgi:tetratricopeptide (TPR) repeat protein